MIEHITTDPHLLGESAVVGLASRTIVVAQDCTQRFTDRFDCKLFHRERPVLG